MEIYSFVIHVLKGCLVMSFPLLMPSLAEALSERSGILHIGLESYMLVGALFSYYGAYFTNSLLLGVIAGMIAGALLSLGFGFLAIRLRASQIICGIGTWMFGVGFTNYLFRLIPVRDPIHGLSDIHIRVLSDIPLVGPIFFQQNVLVYLGLLLVVIFYVLFYFTPFGVLIRGTGDNPLAVDMAGHNVFLIRYICSTVCGAVSGLGGAYLVLVVLHQFSENMTAGRGFIALCIVIFGNWNPWKILLGALLFAGIDALQLRLQIISDVPYPIFLMAPYVLTLVVLVGFVRKVDDPIRLMIPYKKGEA